MGARRSMRTAISRPAGKLGCWSRAGTGTCFASRAVSLTSTASGLRSRKAARCSRQARQERAAAILRDGLALWRGPPLADFAYEAFAQAPIAQLEDLHLSAVEERVEADLALGRQRDLVGELTSLVAAKPAPGAGAGTAHARVVPLGPPSRSAAGLPGIPACAV